MTRHLLTASTLLIATPAMAQQEAMPIACGPTKVVESSIAKRYGENPIAAGVAQGGGYLFIITNPETQSYTVILRRPDGTSCMLGSGSGFTVIEPTKPGMDL